MIRNPNSLNEALKQRGNAGAADQNAPLALDDTQRVKVLSPGRLVAKRFFRNKLAIIGMCVLIFMFLFAFLCPLFYPYGQTEVFYKYDTMLINYGIASERGDYTSHMLDSGAEIHYSVKNMMTSYIKEMEADGLRELNVADSSGSPYVVEKLGDGVFSLSVGEMETVASLPAAHQVGELNKFTAEFKPAKGFEAPEGFAEAGAAALKDGKDSFRFDDVEYNCTKGSTKMVFKVSSAASDTVIYEGKNLGAEFESAFHAAAADTGVRSFSSGGKEYSVLRSAEGVTAALKGDSEPVMVSSVFVFDAVEAGQRFSDAFEARALLNMYGSGSFEDEGAEYRIKRDDEDSFSVTDAAGNEVAMISSFVVRRYDGSDTLSLDFKETVSDVISEMEANHASTASFRYLLPQTDEVGAYVYDENGDLIYCEQTIEVEKKLSQYVLRSEQTTYLIDIYAPPSEAHPFGTDADGMDILARMMYGGRVSLMVGFVVVILESLLGIIMGGLAGFFGGWVDTFIMRLVDIFYCIPTYPILIILGAIFDALRLSSYVRLVWMMAVLGILGWASVARLVRGQILSLREQEFMVAEEATGMRISRRIFRHLIPNVMPQLIVSATMGLGSVIITESTLSFLGLGVKRPLATWGTMINAITSSNENLIRYSHIWIPVGLLICLTVIAFNFVGDGLRDAFDPKMKQ